MKKCIAMFLLVAFLGCGSTLMAADSECDCNCTKGGLGLKIGKFVVGFGVKHYNTKMGCTKNFGVMFGLGGETSMFGLGFGFDQGTLGLGLFLRGSESTTTFGFGAGYDYSDCRMVWPIEE